MLLLIGYLVQVPSNKQESGSPSNLLLDILGSWGT